MHESIILSLIKKFRFQAKTTMFQEFSLKRVKLKKLNYH